MGHKRSYAAYALDDVADAKRGSPDVSLADWAAGRGLEFRGSEVLGAFAHVMPLWPDYVFNLAKGTVAPGRFGYVAHELDEVSLDDDGGARMPGGYFAMRVHGKSRGLLDLMGISIDKKRPNEPFAAISIWVPTTAAAVRVPDAALLPAMTIRSADRFPLAGNPKLDDGGLPGFRMAGSQWIGDDLRLALAGAARPVGALGAAYASVRLDAGLVSVRRNGFVAGAELDALADAAVAIAEGIAAIARPGLSPQPFEQPLPAPAMEQWPPGYVRPERHEVDALARLAGEIGMVQEDAVALHRTQPRCPVPGRALGVLRGVLPSTGATGRVAVFSQGRHTSGTYRSAVIAPAAPGATTPVGGVRHEASDLYVEVADGVAYAWPRGRSAGAFNAAATVAAAVQTLTAMGLAQL